MPPTSTSPTLGAYAASGPQELLRLKAEYLLPCVYHFYRDPPQLVAGQGCTLIDHEGREYLDAYSGVTVVSAGHGNPAVVEAAVAQLRALSHTTTIYLTEPMLRLAERLASVAPGPLKRSFFCASGTEAVEGALLAASLHTGRREILAFTDSLHGRTRWTMSATGLDMWRTDPDPIPGVHRARFGDANDVRRILAEHGERIAAVIGEPVQGNGGINVPDESFWPEVRRLCDEHGALLVFDEIQTGFGRTGRWFAGEHWGVVPDVMAMSKALGNGLPIAAFITTDEIARGWTRPSASTGGGNLVCAAAALATIDCHAEHDLAGNARRRGAQLRRGLEELLSRRGRASWRPRGLGLMLGVPVLDDAGAPDAAACDALLESLREEGVLAGKTGPGRNVLTFMPPLVIDERQIERVLEALDAALPA